MHLLIRILIQSVVMIVRASRRERITEFHAPRVEIPDDTPFACIVTRYIIGAAMILSVVCWLAPWFHVGVHDESLLFAGPLLVDTMCAGALVGSCVALIGTMQPNRWWKRVALPCLALGIAATIDMISTVPGLVATGCVASLVLQVIVFITAITVPTRSDAIPPARIAQ